MADETNRPSGGKGRRGVFRRPAREAVPAHGTVDFDPPNGDDDGGDAGSAGVREPRRPPPLGPLADAGELPVPESRYMVALPDPRR